MTAKKVPVIVDETVDLGVKPKKKPGRKKGEKPAPLTGSKLAERCVRLAKSNSFTLDQLVYFLNKYRDIEELEQRISEAKHALEDTADSLPENPGYVGNDFTVGDPQPFGEYEAPF